MNLKSQQDLYVELDIVLPGDTLLSKAHDISQSLQDQLETLPSVTRAFVHVDHEVRLALSRTSRFKYPQVSHTPEHRKLR
jgi:divalent metal cation (Fe/Co/Zn/Cd) transporter